MDYQATELRDFVHNQAAICSPSPAPSEHDFQLPNQKVDIQLKTVTRHESIEDVHNTMQEMDRMYSTSFTEWIRSEANLHYICLYKGNMIREYVETDIQSSLVSLAWLVQDWDIANVAQLILALFHKYRICSPKFAAIVHGITESWNMDDVMYLVPILLVNEPKAEIAAFIRNFKVASGCTTLELTELTSFTMHQYRWDLDEMTDFLIAFNICCNRNEFIRESLNYLIREELGRLEKYSEDDFLVILQNTVESLFQLIGHEKVSNILEQPIEG